MVPTMGVRALTGARDRLLRADERRVSSTEACQEIVLALHEVAVFDCCAVMTTDPATMLPSTGVVDGFPSSACPPFRENDLADPDFNKFSDLVRRTDPVSTLHESVDGELHRSPRYTKLYAATGAMDELRVVFTAGSACLAVGALLRPAGLDPFTDEEIADVRQLVPVATRLLRQAQGRGHDDLRPAGPAVIILDGEAKVLSMTEGADALLDDLRLQVDGSLPGTLQAAATKARWSRQRQSLTTRLRGHSGRWLRAHISPMAGEVGTVAVTLEAARSDDLAVLLLDSYGLTERETEIVLRLCRGLATKEIASELLISVHTVRDHIKSIFDKAGVTSRGELVAELFTSHVLGGFHEAVQHVGAVDGSTAGARASS